MNKKIIMGLVVVSFLLVGVVSADLLPWFGQITGSATVEAPSFYLGEQIGTGVTYDLLTNEKPEAEEEINWVDGETIKFKSDSLGVDHFYDAEFNFIFYAKANATDRRIQMKVTKLNEDGTQGSEICASGAENITATEYYSNYELSCTSDGEISLDENQGFVLEVFGLGDYETDEYWLSAGDGSREYGASRMEVTAA